MSKIEETIKDFPVNDNITTDNNLTPYQKEPENPERETTGELTAEEAQRVTEQLESTAEDTTEDMDIELPVEEPDELKEWFQKEYSKLEEVQDELKEAQEQLELEKKQFYEEKKKLEHGMEIDRKRLAQENSFFDQKMKILQSGFEQLEEDKRKFEKEKNKFNAKKEVYDESHSYFQRSEITEMLFRGVNSFLALKKRYKDLIKMYHPDNVAGDHEMVQIINKEYEELKKAYEVGKQA